MIMDIMRHLWEEVILRSVGYVKVVVAHANSLPQVSEHKMRVLPRLRQSLTLRFVRETTACEQPLVRYANQNVAQSSHYFHEIQHSI